MMYDDEQMLSFWRFSSKAGVINVILSSEGFHEAKIVLVNIKLVVNTGLMHGGILYKGTNIQR